MLRLDYLDVDMSAPADAKVRGRDNHQLVDLGACEFTVAADPPAESLETVVARLKDRAKPDDPYYHPIEITTQEKSADGWKIVHVWPRKGGDRETKISIQRMVGAMRVDCLGNIRDPDDQACIETACASLKPIPGGHAEKPYPSDPPVIEVGSGGGLDGGSRGGVTVFADGTVHGFGRTCPKWRDGMTKVEPSVVSALVDSLIKTLPEQHSRYSDCPDGVTTWIDVRSGATKRRASYNSCSDKEAEPIREAVSKVRALAKPCR